MTSRLKASGSKSSFLETTFSTGQQSRAAYGRAMHRLMIYRDTQPQVSQDQIDQAVQRVLKGLISEKLPRELEKVQSQTISAKEFARILREIMTFTKEAE